MCWLTETDRYFADDTPNFFFNWGGGGGRGGGGGGGGVGGWGVF